MGSGTGSLEMVDKVGKRTCLFLSSSSPSLKLVKVRKVKGEKEERRRRGSGGPRRRLRAAEGPVDSNLGKEVAVEVGKEARKVAEVRVQVIIFH